MQVTHQIKSDDTFGWHLVQNLLNFGDSIRRKSTGLIITPDNQRTTFLTEHDLTATDWQLYEEKTP